MNTSSKLGQRLRRTGAGAPARPGQVEEGRLAIEYILPLKWLHNAGLPEMTGYLQQLSCWVDITVVDGSAPEVFAEHHTHWGSVVRHIPPAGPATPNGKVHGVLTGLGQARHERIIIADDDVRYTRAGLHLIAELLDHADLVRPQNYFSQLPWHARWDTARTLINRALGSDYPGTLGVRRQALPHGYRGDVLFENLELIRTVLALGGRQIRADDVFIARLPPTTGHFLGQRVRQAYDSQAQPLRLAIELSLLPLLLVQSRRPLGYLCWIGAAVGVAVRGRKKDHGSTVFPSSAPLWAPLWVGERALTAWFALGYRACGGIKYSGGRIRDAASPQSRFPSGSSGSSGSSLGILRTGGGKFLGQVSDAG